MDTKIKSYETSRLTLKPTGVEDAEFILELLNSPGWIKYIGDRHVYTVDQARTYIKEKMLPQQAKLGYGNYTLISKNDGAKLGTSGIYARPNMDNVDIGFAMLPQYISLGYSYEASNKLMYLAEHEFGIKSITAATTYDNIPSQNLIKKLGMHYIKDVKWPGDDAILMLFGLDF